MHNFLRQRSWTKSIWPHLVQTSCKIFVSGAISIKRSENLSNRSFCFYCLWLWSAIQTSSWCLGLWQGVWGEVRSSKHTLSQYLSEQQSNLNMCIRKLASPCTQQRQILPRSISLHWFQLNSWSEIEQIRPVKWQSKSLSTRRRAIQAWTWRNGDGAPLDIFFSGSLGLQSLESPPLRQTCAMHLNTFFPRGQHLLTAGF